MHGFFLGGGEGGGSRGVIEGGKGGGSGTQKFVYKKWPDKIFPMVNFVFAHDSHFGLGGGFGMTPWCDDLVCSWRRLLADRHSLPFPWTLSLHRLGGGGRSRGGAPLLLRCTAVLGMRISRP